MAEGHNDALIQALGAGRVPLPDGVVAVGEAS